MHSQFSMHVVPRHPERLFNPLKGAQHRTPLTRIYSLRKDALAGMPRPSSPALLQQHGYFHAGVTTSIADSAAGYAAYTLFEPGAGVLTTELKINLLRPAVGD